MVGQHTPRKSISGRIFAILGVLILVGSMAPVPWLVEEGVAQPNPPSLKVTRSDYRTEVEEIRGQEAFAYVVLEDASRSIYDARGVVDMAAKVTHRDNSQHDVWFALMETGIGTGIFQGGFNFTLDGQTADDQVYHQAFESFGITNTGPSPQNARLFVEDDSTITVATEERDGFTTRTTSFDWFTTDDAERLRVFVDGSPDHYLECTFGPSCAAPSTAITGHSVLDIEIKDAGLNRDDGKRETYPNLVRVFSTSNPEGTTVSIQEVNDNDPRFLGKLTLTDTTGSSGLFVQDGDKFYFQYLEPHAKDGEAKNHLHPAEGVDFVAERQTSISVDRSVYYGLTDPSNKHGEDRVVVTITDTDRANKESVLEKPVKFTLRVKNGQTTIYSNAGFEATQLGPRSDTYVATIQFGDENSPSKGIIDVNGHDRRTIEVEFNGEKKTSTWRAVKDARFTFENEDGDSLSESFFTGQDTYRICLTDPDSRGKSSITVRVKTSSDTANGLGVTLSSVPNDPVNCVGAHFAGEFSFTTGSTGGGAVSVADGDLVIFEYDDPFVKRDGSNQIVRSPLMRWWQTEEPEDPNAPDGRKHAAEAERDIVSVQFVTSDSDTPSSPPEPGQGSFTEVDRVNEGSEVHLRLEFENDNNKALPVTGAADVTLRTEHCDTKDLTVVVFEESEGSRFYSGVINFTSGPEGHCDNQPGFNHVPVTPDMGLGPATPAQNMKIFDLVEAFKTEEGNSEPEALLGWFPADNAELSVTDGYGNGAFMASLFDRDMLPHFVFAEEVSLENDRWYNFTFVGGSEWVVVDRSESFTYSGSGPTSRQVDASTDQPIVGGEFRLPHCDFVSISYVISGPLGSSGNLNCQGINGRTVSFSAPPNCPAVGATCTVTIEYKYRAQPVAQGTDWSCDGGNQFRYFRTSDGIVFCQDQSNNVVIDYVGGERVYTGIGPGGEEEDSTLTFDGFDGSPGVPIFRGDVPVWFETGSSPIDVMFTYLDPAQDFDGGPGSDDPDHLRSTFSRSTWRPSETGEIRIMKDDFSGTHSGTVFGPAIAVEVLDLDASHPDRRDQVNITAALSSDGPSCAESFLRETGPNTGVFRGLIDLPDGGDLGGCVLVTNGLNSIHLAYTDAHDADGKKTDVKKTVNLRTSERGVVLLCRQSDCSDEPPLDVGEEFRGVSDSFYVRVTDRDQTPKNTLKVRVASQSQPLGEQVTLTRVGTGPFAYFVSDELRFETTMNQGNGRLFVTDDDKWWVSYDDPMDNNGKANPVRKPTLPDSFIWKQVWDGSVSFDRAFHIGDDPGAIDSLGKGLQRLARGVVVLNDRDLTTTRTEIDVVPMPSGLELRIDEDNQLDVDGGLFLVETAHNTGIFIGVFSFGSGGGNCGDAPTGFPCVSTSGANSIPSGSKFEVLYEDVDATRVDHNSTAEATWVKEGVGVVSFDRGGYTVDRDPVVTIYDANLGSQNTVSVSVVSQTDSSGISKNLGLRDDVKDDDPDDRHGIYRDSIGLHTSASSGRNLQVNAENDEIEARYQDSDPPGTRKATALIGVGSEPVTSLVTTPSSPDGDNGWFISQVTVELDTNVAVEDTFYRRNGGTVQTFSTPITLSEGIHDFEFWSVDLFEGFEEKKKTATVKVSLNDPTAEIELGEVSELPDGQIELNWEAVSGKTDPLLFGQYKVYRGDEGAAFADTELVSENVSSETFTDRPPSDNPPQLGEKFTYYVRVANEAGRVGPLSDAVDALSDRVAPRVSSFDVDRNTLRENLGEDTVNADLSVEGDQENLDDIDRVFLRVIDPFGNQEAEVNMTGSSTSFSAAYTEFDTCGVYGLFGIASDAVGNEGRLNQSVRFIGLDVDAPQLRGVPTQVQQGQDLNVTVVDNCAGVASVAYSINDGDRREVNVPARLSGDNCTPGPCEVSFQISASRLVPGENRITFELSDANETANFATIRHTVTMIIPDDDDETLDAPSLGDAHSNLVEYGGRFSFTVSGGTPTTIAFAAGDLDLDNVIGGLTRSTGRVRVDISDLESGPHTAKVTVTNAFGTDTADFSFYILEEGIPLPPVNVQVSKNDKGQPVISWSPNPDSIVEVGGYLVHRASSPWKVIAVTDADTETYTDTKAKEGQTYRYAVTSYGANGEGRLNEGDDSEESLAWFQGVGATTFQTDEIDGGIPPVVFWVILIVLAVVVVVSLLYVNRRQIFGSKAEEIYAEEYPDEAETPFGEERHMIRCPNCSEDFHVSGERPVVTDCPNCGRKGILR